MNLPHSEFNMPPGVSTGDIPGNKTEFERICEEQAEDLAASQESVDEVARELDDIAPEPPSPTDTSDLDALLGEAMTQQLERDLAETQAKVEAKAVADARKRLMTDPGGLTATEREALRKRILTWETEHEWLPQQMLYVEEVDLCACGVASAHFLGLYQIQTSRLKAETRRIVNWTLDEDKVLPRAFHRIGRAVAACPACREAQGFALQYAGDLWSQEASMLEVQQGEEVK